MDVITVVNQKGGVGKTATSLNLGGALAEAGHDVLLVDLDPQAHLTHALAVPEAAASGPSLAGLLLGTWSGDLGELLAPAQVPPGAPAGRGRLDVVASGPACWSLEQQLYTRPGRELLLGRALDDIGAAGVHDVAVVDCPPSLGVLTDTAIVAARTEGERRGGLLIPVQPEDASLDAVRLLRRQVEALADVLRVQVRTLGMLLSLCSAADGRLVADIMASLQQREGCLGVIRRRSVIREAWRQHAPVVDVAPTSDAADWYRELARRTVKVLAA